MKKILLVGLTVAILALVGCKDDAADTQPAEVIDLNPTTEEVAVVEETTPVTENATTESEQTTQPAVTTETTTTTTTTTTSPQITVIDNTGNSAAVNTYKDYSTEIEAEVNSAVSISGNIQTEIENVAKVAEKYQPLADAAQTQDEINMSSKWFYTIWDKELNSLWSRINSLADDQTKARLLADQQNWLAMIEEVKIDNIGTKEAGGSMYPYQENTFMKEITYNRCLVLANELAKLKGETFTMPAHSKYGTFVDNQGTSSVYGYIVTKKSIENQDVAEITIDGMGFLEGIFADYGNGDLSFISYDQTVKGNIHIDGWNGATFMITECTSGMFTAGDTFEFNFVY